MMNERHRVQSAVRAGALAAVALVMVACAEAPSAPEQSLVFASRAATGTLPDPSRLNEQIWVCKFGSSATFSVARDGGAAATHTLADGECKSVFAWPGGTDPFGVTVTELVEPGLRLDSIVIAKTRDGYEDGPFTSYGTQSYRADIAPGKGAVVRFYNTRTPPPPPPPTGGQGCTPGYWKQSQHFDSWTGYSPNTQFSAVFENAFPGKTLVQVLGLGGGGLNALGRHTVAALLSASSPGVDYGVATPAEVIAAFNAVFPGGDYETLKNRFAAFNEAGCPLN